MRRLRSCLASTGSGGRRRPSAPTRRGCASARDGAGERRRKPSGSAPRFARRSVDAPVPTRSGPPVRNRRDGAPEGDADRRRRQAVAGPRPATQSRLSARHLPSVVEGHTGKARFARRREADGAWADFTSPHTPLSSPAKAGDPENGSGREESRLCVYWIPACAGMTWEFGATSSRSSHSPYSFPSR